MTLALGLVKDEDVLVRRSAARALVEMTDEKSAWIVLSIIECLHDSDENVRSSCCEVIERIGPEARSSVPELIRSLDDAAPNVRSHAAKALGSIGTAAKNALPQLITVVRRDRLMHVRWCAADALGGIGTEAELAIPSLEEARENKDEELRRRAEQALAKIKVVKKN